MSESLTTEYPATWTVHWPTGPVAMCDQHAEAAQRIGAALGMHVAMTPLFQASECRNCANAALKEKDRP